MPEVCLLGGPRQIHKGKNPVVAESKAEDESGEARDQAKSAAAEQGLATDKGSAIDNVDTFG